MDRRAPGKHQSASASPTTLGFTRLDTGALYRAVALEATRREYTTESPELGSMVRNLDVGFGDAGVTLNGHVVEAAIRTPQMSAAASAFSAVPAVRAALLDLQRRVGRSSELRS